MARGGTDYWHLSVKAYPATLITISKTLLDSDAICGRIEFKKGNRWNQYAVSRWLYHPNADGPLAILKDNNGVTPIMMCALADFNSALVL